MAALVLLFVLLCTIGGSEAVWCVCRSDQVNTTLQKALDYACGAGADCTPIIVNGACYNPNTLIAHCSYAANSYFQRKGQTQDACNFMGAAAISSTDPSYTGCTYPATPSAAGTGTTPTGTTPTTGTLSPPGMTPPGGAGFTPPSGFTPTATGYTGLGPTGTGSLDGSHSNLMQVPSFGIVVLSGLVSLVVMCLV